MPLVLLTTIARHQLLVTVHFIIGSYSVQLAVRSVGGLTGSFLAVLLSRVPTDVTLRDLHDTLKLSGFELFNNVTLTAAAWVDNLIFVSRIAKHAIPNAELVAAHLRDMWGLNIKHLSKEYLVCAGASDTEVVGNDWACCDVLTVLGWPLQKDGGFREIWSKLESKAWRSFWGNVRCRG